VSYNKVTIIGNLGRDPETRYTPSGTMNVQFSVATSRRFNDREGQQQESTTWFRITAWGRLAETLDKLTQSGALAKGRQVYVEGRLEQREFTGQDGQTRSSLDVNASEFQLIGSRNDGEGGGSYGGGGGNYGGGGGGQRGGGGGGGRQQPQAEADYGDMDDVPF
jgi:single-strand DNA-binding protein